MGVSDAKVENYDRRIPHDLKALAVFLDSKFEGPFGFRFGWDALIGLIPGLGAVLPTLISLYIVVRAILLRVSVITIFHMLVNVLIDTTLSLIPIAGQFADFFWKSNLKNLELMDRYFTAPTQTVRNSGVFLVLLGTGFLSLIGFLIGSIVMISRWLIQLL